MSEGGNFTVGEAALARGLCSNMRDTQYLCVCRRTKLPGRGIHSEKVRDSEVGS